MTKKNKTEEAKFKNRIFSQLNQMKFNRNKIELGKDIPILKDLTVQKINDKFRLNFGFFKQDLVLYLKKQIPKSYERDYYNYDKLGKREIIIPLIIFELKIGANLTSHQLITYSEIALEIKGIYPWIKYNLLMDKRGEKQDKTLTRHGKHFDEIIIIKEDSYNYLRKIAKNQLKSMRRLNIY